MQQVYKIDMSKISGIRRRAVIRTLKTFGITIAIMIIARYFSVDHDVFISDLWTLPIVLAVLLFVMYRSVGRLVKIYETLEVTLTDAGIERRAETWAYKTIKWPDMQIKQKSNGIIDLYDKNVSALDRKMYGKGYIQIQPEIKNIDILTEQIQRNIFSS
ncbi:MAG: hypothetical protein JWR09_1774 [Mucilaginibacter sp.]|nr:hypothetical protein [Mucilaginibacter sp.]